MSSKDMDIEEKILSELLNNNYDESNLLQQYKLLVENANEISNRRENTNRFYLTLITVLFGIITFLANNYPIWFSIFPLIFIIIISVIWKNHIREYKLLNTVKFKLINYLEGYLPVNAFTKEWELLKHNGYTELTKWDEKVPNCLIILSIIIIVLISVWECLTIGV